jgi:hypothetical protein
MLPKKHKYDAIRARIDSFYASGCRTAMLIDLFITARQAACIWTVTEKGHNKN